MNLFGVERSVTILEYKVNFDTSLYLHSVLAISFLLTNLYKVMMLLIVVLTLFAQIEIWHHHGE